MSMIDWLFRRFGARVGNGGLNTAERRRLAAEYQEGAAARPTAAQMEDLRAKMAALSKHDQPPPAT